MNYLTYQKRLAYLLELLTKEATVSPSIMSKKFECSTKTIKRMVTHLREDGYEIKWCRKKKSYVIENVIAYIFFFDNERYEVGHKKYFIQLSVSILPSNIF